MTQTPDTSRSLTYLAAINEALAEEMRRDPDVLVMGEDVGGEFGGAFKVTKGLAAEFGPKRVMNTPLAELGFTGMASGMALMGLRPVVEMQFADFISTAFDSIVQFASSAHYRWGGAVPIVIRAPSDGGLRSGPFHSQNPEAWFVHVPGLKVVAPATPADAKGLLIAAIRDNNPVIYFESKLLYRSLKGHVPEGEYVVPIGKAHLARSGDDLSIITYGAQLHQALAAAERLAGEGIECDVLDLRTLKPLDEDADPDQRAQNRQNPDRAFGQPAGRPGRRARRAHRRQGVRVVGRPHPPARRSRHAHPLQPAPGRRLPTGCRENLRRSDPARQVLTPFSLSPPLPRLPRPHSPFLTLAIWLVSTSPLWPMLPSPSRSMLYMASTGRTGRRRCGFCLQTIR